MRVGIITPGLSAGDAIGHDAIGMYSTAVRHGFESYLFTASGDSTTSLPTYHYSDVRWLLDDPDDLLIYHYGTWDQGGLRELNRVHGRIAIKYHNVTPSVYLSPYSVDFARATRMARESIQELMELPVSWFLSDSRFNAEELARFGAPTERNLVIPPFHVVADLLAAPDDGPMLARLDAYPNNILAVGRLVPNKGYDVMLDSLADVVRDTLLHPHLHIVGAGDDPRLESYVGALRSIIERNGIAGNVTFHGPTSMAALATLFRRADLYWTSSRHEGFCVPAVEAMGFGKPVLSSRMGALLETCAGAAFFADTRAECTRALIHLLSDDEERIRLGAVGRRRYENVFQARHVAAAFGDLLDRMAIEVGERVPAVTLACDGAWFDLPDADRLVAWALAVSDPLCPDALDGTARRRDFVDQILREGWRRSPEITCYLRSKRFADYVAEIDLPRAAAHFSAGMRLAVRFSRFVQSTFDLRSPDQVNEFVRWYRREAPYGLDGADAA